MRMGGSGSAERVVSDDFGTDWTAEITSSSNRMRKGGRNHMKTTVTTEAVSSPPDENELWNTNRRRNTTCAGQKPRADWKNVLQTYEKSRKSRKPPTPVVGIKPNGKSQINWRGTRTGGVSTFALYDNDKRRTDPKSHRAVTRQQDHEGYA